MKIKKCKECGAYTYENKEAHTPSCSLMSSKYARKELIRYWEGWQKLNAQLGKIREVIKC